jgi:hypothetical protein
MAGKAEALVAVWDGASRGTKHMIREAGKRGLRVFVYETGRPEEDEPPKKPQTEWRGLDYRSK